MEDRFDFYQEREKLIFFAATTLGMQVDFNFYLIKEYIQKKVKC